MHPFIQITGFVSD